MAATSLELRNVVKDFPAGVTVVTSTDVDGNPVGATVSAFASLSLEPPLVLFCLTSESRCARAIRASRAMVVHILGEDQSDLAMRFASDLSDKFEGVPFERNSDGAPFLNQCRVRLECRLFNEVPGGDHAIFLGYVEVANNLDDFRPLVHANRRFARLADLDSTTG